MVYTGLGLFVYFQVESLIFALEVQKDQPDGKFCV